MNKNIRRITFLIALQNRMKYWLRTARKVVNESDWG